MNIEQNNLQIGQRIKAKREELKLSQEELANMIGSKNRSTVSNYENGARTFTQAQIMMFAKALNTSPAYLMGWRGDDVSAPIPTKVSGMIKIPILGTVRAGSPTEAIEDVLGYVHITEGLARQGDYFALQIRGDSMEPRLFHGDIVIVRRQPYVTDGEIGVFLVNGYDSTVKKFRKTNAGIDLIPYNDEYPVQHYSKKEAEDLPVTCLGKVVEMRANF